MARAIAQIGKAGRQQGERPTVALEPGLEKVNVETGDGADDARADARGKRVPAIGLRGQVSLFESAWRGGAIPSAPTAAMAVQNAADPAGAGFWRTGAAVLSDRWAPVAASVLESRRSPLRNDLWRLER